jgi:hypothetical protein
MNLCLWDEKTRKREMKIPILSRTLLDGMGIRELM